MLYSPAKRPDFSPPFTRGRIPVITYSLQKKENEHARRCDFGSCLGCNLNLSDCNIDRNPRIGAMDSR